MNKLLELLDGGILKIEYDSESYSGCDTCDYGSSYVNEYEIKMTKGTIHIKVSQMYDYFLSEGFMMETILGNVDEIKNMTEQGFFEWLKDSVTKHVESDTSVEVPVIDEFVFNIDTTE